MITVAVMLIYRGVVQLVGEDHAGLLIDVDFILFLWVFVMKTLFYSWRLLLWCAWEYPGYMPHNSCCRNKVDSQ